MSTIYEGWAVIEMMGHRKFAGKVTPVEGYSGLLTIEMPGAERPIIVGAGAIFQITPVDQEFAQMVGKQYLENSAWGAPHLRTLLPSEELKQLAAMYDPDEGDEPDDDLEEWEYDILNADDDRPPEGDRWTPGHPDYRSPNVSEADDDTDL